MVYQKCWTNSDKNCIFSIFICITLEKTRCIFFSQVHCYRFPPYPCPMCRWTTLTAHGCGSEVKSPSAWSGGYPRSSTALAASASATGIRVGGETSWCACNKEDIESFQPLDIWVLFSKCNYNLLMLLPMNIIFSFETGSIQRKFSLLCGYWWPGALGHR